MLRRYASQVRLPGFRPGKAPLDLVRKRFAKEIDDDVRERLISRLWREATREKGLHAAGRPGRSRSLEARGRDAVPLQDDVRGAAPAHVKDYRGVEAAARPRSPRDEEVDEGPRVDPRSRTPASSPTTARLAEPGDVLVADVDEHARGGEPNPPRADGDRGRARRTTPTAFNAKIAGAAAGADARVRRRLPGRPSGARSWPGRRVSYAIHVHEVKRQRDPAARRRVRQGPGRFRGPRGASRRASGRISPTRKEAAAAVGASARRSSTRCCSRIPSPLPDILVEEEIRHRLEDMVREMMFHGVDPRTIELDWKQLRDRQEEPARKIVHARLVLDAIAAAEDVRGRARARFDERIRHEAERIGEEYDALRGRLREGGRRASP